MSLSGIIILDKPAGISSARAVARVKRLLPRGTKIGHAGTLDPFATGVLLLLVGPATKLCESLMDQPKTYEATIKFGATTETDDPDSPEQPGPNRPPPEISEIEKNLQQFIGPIQQRPPKFSALKLGGRRAYDLARRGKSVNLPARPVRIDSIEILNWTWPELKIRVQCGRGTYIRGLARDLGEALGVGGYLLSLRRARIGDFHDANAITLDQISANGAEKFLISV